MRAKKREVAIKVLPADVSSDAERVSRFQREAEVLATLNHPNIAAIYDLSRFGETQSLLELVEAKTRPPPRPALEAAHERDVCTGI